VVAVETKPKGTVKGSGGAGAPMIEAEGLTRMYGDFYAVRDISFSIPRGQVVAFLGPNGAGKSTTMKLLTGVLAPTSGRARLCGMDVATDRLAAAEKLGYLPENGPLYPDMTPRSLLSFFARARGMSEAQTRERMAYVVEHCRLEEVIGKPIGKLSKGYRQHVGMAQALLNQVEHVRELLRALAKTKTILLSTHILREVKAVAERILFVHQGRLVHDGPVSSLGDTEQAMEQRFHGLTV